jgi:hypothetical protein
MKITEYPQEFYANSTYLILDAEFFVKHYSHCIRQMIKVNCHVIQLKIVLIHQFSEETLPITNFLIFSVSFLCFYCSVYLILFFSIYFFLFAVLSLSLSSFTLLLYSFLIFFFSFSFSLLLRWQYFLCMNSLVLWVEAKWQLSGI